MVPHSSVTSVNEMLHLRHPGQREGHEQEPHVDETVGGAQRRADPLTDLLTRAPRREEPRRQAVDVVQRQADQDEHDDGDAHDRGQHAVPGQKSFFTGPTVLQ